MTPVAATCVTASCLLLCAAPTARAQTPLFDIHGELTFGYCLAAAGDVDGDGHGDVVIGIPWAETFAKQGGAIELRSGHDSHVLWRVDTHIPQGMLGESLGTSADIDGDGVPDVIAGAGFDESWLVDAAPAAVVLSGTDGQTLHHWDGPTDRDLFGRSVDAAGDVDADGFVDVIIGAPEGSWMVESGPGYAQIRSGLDGSLLHELKAVGKLFGGFGYDVGGAGDVDADGHADVIVGAPMVSRLAFHAGAAQILSGADGHPLATSWGNELGGRYGSNVAAIGDADADGCTDFVVTGEIQEEVGGTVSEWQGRVISGRHFGTLWLLPGQYSASPGNFVMLGVMQNCVAAAGDLDADGFDDVIVKGGHWPWVYMQQGAGIALSGANGAPLFFVEGLPKPPLSDLDFPGAVAGAGDIDGDGRPDLALSATGYAKTPLYVRVVSGHPLVWSDAGGGTPGGSLSLHVEGALQPNSLVHATLAGGLPQGIAWLVIGAHQIDLPLGSGTLVPAPEVVTVVPLDASGGFDVAQQCHDSVVVGLQVWVQAFASTPAAPGALSASPAATASTN